MKCILLVRVSTEQQSYDAQMQELHEIALKDGYQPENIVAVAEKESGIKLSEEERAGLNRMKELIETGEYNCVYAWEISRIARRKKILFSILEYLVGKKIQLIIKEPSIHLLKTDGTIDEGAETIFTVIAQYAESEMRNKMARFKRAKDEGYRLGKYEGGRITRGYKVNANRMWEIDEEGAKFIRLIFGMYNSGFYSQTQLAKELLARGYFYKTVGKDKGKTQLSITSVKNELSHILKNPIYRGGQQLVERGGETILNSNNYPQIIDDETWELCCQRRKKNRCIPKAKNEYLLTPLIRCVCGASYSVNLVDGCYNCRVKHNGVEKGLEHSPNIHANLIESLAWYVALMELQGDNAVKAAERKSENEAEIAVIKQKIAQSEKTIDDMMKRKKRLDEDYYVNMTITENRYDEFSRKQNDAIKSANADIKKYRGQIAFLEEQNENAITMDEMFDTLRGQFETIKGGTDITTMRSIVRRYIKNITIEPVEGKLTSFWKKVKIELFDAEIREKQIRKYEEQGLHEIAVTIGTTFYLDCHHYIAYWDEDHKYQVPMVLMNRIKRTRIENRKNRKRKRTQNPQY